MLPTLMLGAIVSLAEPAAQADRVDQAIALARAHAAVGDFDGALATVRDAAEETGDPALIFVEAQLLRFSGDCGAAMPRYRAFLATDPAAEDQRAAADNLELCEREIGGTTEPTPVSPSITEPSNADKGTSDGTATAQPSVTRSASIIDPRLERPPRRVDAPGIALWTAGGATLATGVGLFAASWGQRGNAQDGGPTLDTYLGREERAQTLSGVGIGLMTAGASVLVAAGIREIVRARRRHRQRASVLSSFGRLRGAWR